MEKIGCAVIGAGIWGELHARVYDSSPYADLVGVCDLNESRARNIAQTYGAKCYEIDYRKLLERADVKVVSVVTPDFAHTAIARDAANAGKHLLVEKPLATSVEECQEIINAAKKNKVKLMVDFHNRWNPPFYLARQAIEKGEIGSPIFAYYRLSDKIYVPTRMLSWASRSTVAWFIGSHALDTLCWLIGDEVSRVYAVSRSRVLSAQGIDTPDFYQTTLEFRNGVTAVMENCWILPNTTPNIIDLKCEVVGSNGVLYIDGSHHRVLQKYNETSAVYPDVLVSPEIYGKQMGFAAESIRHFIDCVREDGEPLVTGEDGLRVTKIVVAIEESVRKRQPVEVV